MKPQERARTSQSSTPIRRFWTTFTGFLPNRYNVSFFTEAPEFCRSLKESTKPDLLLMDWHIADDNVRGESPRPAREYSCDPTHRFPIIMLACTVQAELNEVLAAARMGATDVILKPFRERDIDLAVAAVPQGSRTSRRPATTTTKLPLNENTSFVRSSKRMREIESQCRLVARADIPVLILGESGTGKEVAAMLIHKLSAREPAQLLEG